VLENRPSRTRRGDWACKTTRRARYSLREPDLSAGVWTRTKGGCPNGSDRRRGWKQNNKDRAAQQHMYVPYVSLTRQSSSFPPTTHTQNTAPHSTWYLPPAHTSARCCQSEYEATTPSYQMHIRIQNNSSSYTTGCKPPCALLSTRANLRDTRI